ncbi:translocation/assembly module TamB domain-containing protein [Luteibaculum oceani]|uniref:Translocation and assembly module TamB C-terminal domain-containing protein n=1 Tax=Luteibaculum oceani TaxID=1294296 RepID=A0A5C6UZL3_9FLAO|nr:translocation/assembly module TamB domain-containing protein [Luteibaculum oceani]TXC76085.1 hypothetical protein FRX97_11265 [Luteibaculum oceani]
MAVLISLLITLAFLLFYVDRFQTFTANLAANYLKKETGIDINIRSLTVRFPNTIKLSGLMVKDLRGDTLLYSDFVSTSYRSFISLENELVLGNSELNNFLFRIHTPENDSLTNLDRVLEKIEGGESSDSTSFKMLIDGVQLMGGKFYLTGARDTLIDDIDYSNLHVKEINAAISEFGLWGDSLRLNIDTLHAIEPQGLYLERYQGVYAYTNHAMYFEDFTLRSKSSLIQGDLKFKYNSAADFSDFNNKVVLEGSLKPSTVIPSDLTVFVPSFKKLYNQFTISGNIKGPISELTGDDMKFSWGQKSVFKGKFYTYGLPDIEQTYIDFEIDQIVTDYRDLKSVSILVNEKGSIIPENIASLGKIEFGGSFSGFIHDFVAYGRLQSEIGNLDSDLSLNSESEIVKYSGELRSKEFDLGAYFNNKTLGKLTAQLTVNGVGLTQETLDANVKGRVKQLTVKEYKYRDLQLDGKFRDRRFNGEFNSLDPNLNINFKGLVDFRKKLPLYDFTADLYQVNLSALNWLSDTIEGAFTGRVDINAKGNEFSNFTGTAKARNISYCNKYKEFYLGNIELYTRNVPQREINISSTVGSLKLVGEVYPETLVDDLNETLADISAIYFTEPKRKQRTGPSQDFTIECYLTNAELLSGVLNRDFNFEGNFQLLGYYRSYGNKVGFNAVCQNISYGENVFQKLITEGSKNGPVTDLWVNSEDVQLGPKVALGELDFSLKGVSDNFQASLTWDNPGVTNAQLSGLIEIEGKNKGRVDWLPSSAVIRNEQWTLGSQIRTYWDSTGLYFNNLAFLNNTQELNFTGVFASKLERSSFNLDLKNFELSNFNLFGDDIPEFKGVANGNFQFDKKQDSLVLVSDLTIDRLWMNGKDVGNIKVKTTQKDDLGQVGFDGAINQTGGGAARFYGYYYTDLEAPLNLNVDFNKFDLAFLNNQFTEDVTRIRGKAFGNLKIEGSLDHPEIAGKMMIKNGYAFIPYLQCGYGFTDEIVVKPDYIGVNYITVKDDNNRTAKLTGTVFHDNFTNWNYDFFADLKNNLALNTQRFDNSTFFGKALVTGTIGISGYAANTAIEVSVSPEKGTVINIPLDEAEELEDLEYVEFVSPEDERDEDKAVDLSGLSLNFKLDVNPNAQVNLIFDETVGDVISATGSGNITMDIDAQSNFEMYGTYMVSDGDYLFTLENLINKKFNIQQGSTINWYGDPYEAILDLKAEYVVRAPLYDIMPTPDERFKRREPVVLQMKLTDRLVNPNIEFDILLPNADDFVRGQVKSVVNNEQEMNRQVFSLLMLNRFVKPLNAVAGSETSRLGSDIGTPTSELLSNQLSNIFSKISSDFNMGVNIRPGDQVTSREVAVSLSTQVLNERMTISSNLGVTDKTTSNPNGLIGDFSAEYALTKDGKVRLKAFNETADNTYAGSNLFPFIQGVGVAYSTEFDNLKEVWSKFKFRLKRKNK